MANIASVMALAAVLIRTAIQLVDEQTKGDISPALVTFGSRYHLAFLFVSILSLLIAKKVSPKFQLVLFMLNAAMALYMFIHVFSLMQML
jgi:hypothetical protein